MLTAKNRGDLALLAVVLTSVAGGGAQLIGSRDTAQSAEAMAATVEILGERVLALTERQSNIEAEQRRLADAVYRR